MLQHTKKPWFYHVIALLCWMNVFCFTVSAATAIPLVEIGQDEFEAYRYEVGGFGGFTSTLKHGETGTFNSLEFDDTLNWSVMFEGEPYENPDVTMYMENGSYEVTIVPKEEVYSDYQAKFAFTIQNDYEEFISVIPSDIGIYDLEEAEIAYIKEDEVYQYSLPNGFSMTMTVPNGSMTSGHVSVEYPVSLGKAEVYKDGEMMEDLGNTGQYYFTDPGLYEVRLRCFPADYTGSNLNIYNYTVYFRILKNGMTSMHVLNAPIGYEIDFMECGKRPIKTDSKTSIFMEADGEYYVRFRHADGAVPDYTVSFRKDSTKPRLHFPDQDVRRRMEAPVSFEAMEENCTVELFYDGYQVKDYELPLKQGGFYTARITDQAGNFNEYDFFIEKKIKILDEMTTVLLILVIAGALLLVRLNGFSVKR